MVRVILSSGSLWLMDTAFTFELAAEAGYDGVEVMCDERHSTRNAEYLRQLSHTYGLPIPVLHTPFRTNLQGWGSSKTELERVKHTLKLAESLQAERIVVHLPMRIGRAVLMLNSHAVWRMLWRSPDSDFYAWMASGGLKTLQASTRVQVALENMPAQKLLGKPRNLTWWNTVEAWSQVHEHLTLDTTHWGTFGIDPLVALRAAGSRVKHIHLSNYDGKEHRLPQNGHLDLAAFLREVSRMPFDGTVSVEVNPDALAFDNPQATRRKLKETLEFCRQHLSG